MKNPRKSQPRGSLLERFKKKILGPFLHWVRQVIQNLAMGDQKWARFRFVFALFFMLVTIVCLLAGMEIVGDIVNPPPVPTTPGPSPTHTATYTPKPTRTPTLSGPTPTLTPCAPKDVICSQGRKMPNRLRYIYAPLIAALIVLLYGARYIQDVYELSSYSKALRYLLSSVFGFPPYPQLRVEKGEIQLKPGEENVLDKIGGPGYVVIAPGSAVLFERLTGPAAVRPAGIHFVSRFERIATPISLEEQSSDESSYRSLTRDGVPVEARNVRYRYRLLTGKRFSGPAGRAMVEPYPFWPRAIINMAYNRSVAATGYTSWSAAINLAVDSAITGHISGQTIDQLIAPGLETGSVQLVTRKLIQDALSKPSARMSFRNVGIELVFCDIGHLYINDKNIEEFIRNQHVNTWKTYWVGVANKTRADAEARRQAYQDLGRAEVQAELLMSIARSLEDSGLKAEDGSLENLDKIILMRTAQIIEALSENNPKVGE